MIIATQCTWCSVNLSLYEYVIPLRPVADPLTGEEYIDFLCNTCSRNEEVTTIMEKELA